MILDSSCTEREALKKQQPVVQVNPVTDANGQVLVGEFDAITDFPAFPTPDMADIPWDFPQPWDEDTSVPVASTLTGTNNSGNLEPSPTSSSLGTIGTPDAVRAYALSLTPASLPRTAPTFSNDRNETLVHTAARGGDVPTLILLQQAGCALEARDSNGRTPLHAAYEENEMQSIVWVLEQGVDVNAIDDDGRTPLSMAVNNRCHVGVRLMLSHGASLEPRLADDVQVLRNVY